MSLYFIDCGNSNHFGLLSLTGASLTLEAPRGAEAGLHAVIDAKTAVRLTNTRHLACKNWLVAVMLASLQGEEPCAKHDASVVNVLGSAPFSGQRCSMVVRLSCE